MKKFIYFMALPLFFAACGGAPKTAEEAGEVKEASAEATIYTVDTENSILKWEGAKITETVHHGVIKITDGDLALRDGMLEAGSFVIDMNSIDVQDIDEDNGKLKLEGHLKSGDFFLVEEFPTASFEVTGSEALADGSGATHMIKGNLTIKGITKGISFPATVSVVDNAIEANAKFEINRNEWDVVWGGSKTDQSIKDFLQNNLIKDTIAFEVMLKGNS